MESSDDSSDSKGATGQLTKFQSTLGIKLRATDPRYITHTGDYQRCNVDIPVRDVYELLRLKLELSEEVAKVWLTTAEMGFSLTEVGNQEGHGPAPNQEDKQWGRVQQTAGAGVTSDLMDSKRWRRECMIQGESGGHVLRVCVYYCSTYYKAVHMGGGGKLGTLGPKP